MVTVEFWFTFKLFVDNMLFARFIYKYIDIYIVKFKTYMPTHACNIM